MGRGWWVLAPKEAEPGASSWDSVLKKQDSSGKLESRFFQKQEKWVGDFCDLEKE